MYTYIYIYIYIQYLNKRYIIYYRLGAGESAPRRRCFMWGCDYKFTNYNFMLKRNSIVALFKEILPEG